MSGLEGNLDWSLARFAKPRVSNNIGYGAQSLCLPQSDMTMSTEDEENIKDLQRARYALMVDAELALCNGLSKEDWKRSSYVKSTRDKIWWMEEQDIHYVAEYIWEKYSEYFENETGV